jgi:hypothetical protein
MKQASWVYWTFKRLLVCVACLIASAAYASHAGVVELESAQSALLSGAPGADTVWQPLPLPAHWITPESEPLRKQWIRVNFTLNQVPPDGLMLYAPRLYNGGYFYLNGLRLTGAKPPNENEFVRWRRPFLIEMPSVLLLQGDNEVLLETAYRSGVNGVSRFYVGSAAELEARYNTSFFFKHTVTRLVAVFSLVAGVFLLLFWWRRKQEVLYGLLGLASLAWALRTMNFIVEVIPLDLRPLLRFTYYLGTGGFVLCLMLMAMRIMELRNRWLERVLIAYCLIGPLISITGAQWAEPLVDRWWQAGLFAVAAVGIAGLARATWHWPGVCQLIGLYHGR